MVWFWHVLARDDIWINVTVLQWGEVWSSVVIFGLGYFCLRCAKIDYDRSQF